jgi:hypothetical protein
MADMRVQPALGVPGEQLLQTAGQHLGAERHVATPVIAHHGEVLDQEDIGRDLRHLAGGEPHHDDTRLGPAGAQRGGELVAPHRVIDHISTAQRLDRLADILSGAVDQVIRPGRFAHRELVGAAGTGDDPRAHQFADLDGGKPYPARRAKNEQRFTGRQPRLVVERHMRGAIGDLKGGGIGEAHLRWQCHKPLGGEHALLGQAAIAREHRHPAADRRPLDPFAQRPDRPRSFHAQRQWQRRAFLILALGHQKIGKVEPAGGDVDQNLAVPGTRRSHFADITRLIVTGDLKCSHARLLLCSRLLQ